MLTKRDYVILDELRVMAIDVAPAARAKIAAAVVIKNEIVSFGENQLRTHPFQLKYGKNTSAVFWHAETHAIYNALKRVTVDDLARAALYVVRVKRPHANSKNWILGMAKPCQGCEYCAATFGISRMIYSIEDGYVEATPNLLTSNSKAANFAA